MTVQRKEVYKCEVCGIIAEVLEEGAGEMICCGEPMKLMKENTIDASKEKHVPVIEKTAEGWLVKVGSAPHPMEPKHYIQWIELIANGRSYRAFLTPSDKPEALFPVKADKVTAREYCNIHGLWKSA